MERAKKDVKLPEEHVGKASGFTEINTTLPGGDRGSVEELEKDLKKQAIAK
jgi:hypothetical protein